MNGNTVDGLREVAQRISSASSSDITVVDAGDIEVIKFGEDVIATLPKGKDVWFINRSKFPTIATDIKKLADVVQ